MAQLVEIPDNPVAGVLAFCLQTATEDIVSSLNHIIKIKDAEIRDLQEENKRLWTAINGRNARDQIYV